jgi:carbon starvation protein
MSAMPVMIAILCLMAIAFRYYSAWIAARVAVLDDARITPAVRLNDGQNYHPTSKWVLFGHHFAAISGAGPLIGPVLAAQFGYLPGLLWIVIGVCLGGAVQDFLVLVASTRRGGRSLAQIAFQEIGRVGGTTAMTAILFIIVIALAGLGKVVVNALGGEKVVYPADAHFIARASEMDIFKRDAHGIYHIPAGAVLRWGQGSSMKFVESFDLYTPVPIKPEFADGAFNFKLSFPKGSYRIMPGSPWGTFTIAATIPIALFVGLYMYKLRPGKTVEASIIGATLTLAATVAGAWVANHPIGQWFNMTTTEVTWAMAIYGFVAAVLPVWVLLAPRDYLSSFLKIGTIGLLVIGTLIANPKLEAPAYNHIFSGGGPTVGGKIFPFLFITIMCGAISGFHALVSSGTTPKMIAKESHARTIGYGAMLMEGLVAVVAMIAAAALPTQDYYAMNTQLAKVPEFHDRILQVGGGGGIEHITDYETLTQESLRGRTGGAVTLAVGMAHIFDQAMKKVSIAGEESMRSLWKYWYHFAIMFEALFILTTIDAGTRIGRFLLQEVAGKLHPKFGQTGWWPGAIVSTILIVAGWAWFIDSNNFDTIWKMFGIANQMLAVIALTIVTVCIVNEGKARYAWVTVAPLAVVMTTTSSAAIYLLAGHYATWTTQMAKTIPDKTLLFNTALQSFLIFAMLFCTVTIIASGIARILKGARQPVGFPVPVA